MGAPDLRVTDVVSADVSVITVQRRPNTITGRAVIGLGARSAITAWGAVRFRRREALPRRGMACRALAAPRVAAVDDRHRVHLAVAVLATQRAVAEVTVLVGRAVGVVQALAAWVSRPLAAPGDAEIIEGAGVGVIARDTGQGQRRTPEPIVT